MPIPSILSTLQQAGAQLTDPVGEVVGNLKRVNDQAAARVWMLHNAALRGGALGLGMRPDAAPQVHRDFIRRTTAPTGAPTPPTAPPSPTLPRPPQQRTTGSSPSPVLPPGSPLPTAVANDPLFQALQLQMLMPAATGASTPVPTPPGSPSAPTPTAPVGSADPATYLAQLGWTGAGAVNPAANIAAGSDPEAAMAWLLSQQGIAPESLAGQRYQELAPDLVDVYSLVNAAPGEWSGEPDALLSFLQGYADMMQGQTEQPYTELAQLRGTLKAQVHAAINEPGSQIYQDLATLATDPDNQRGLYVYWDHLIGPALRATGTGPLFLQAKATQFDRLVQQYQVAQFAAGAGGGPVPTFPEFLAQSGFGLDF